MTDYIDTAKRLLLEPTGLAVNDLSDALDCAMSGHIDYADLYFQHARSESWALEEGTIKSGSYDIEQGVGVRSVKGAQTGFAYSDEIELTALKKASNVARSIAANDQTGKTNISLSRPSQEIERLYTVDDPLNSLSNTEKINLLKQADQIARGLDPRVSQVMASLAGGQSVVLIANSEGGLTADIRPMVRMSLSVIVEHNGRREQGRAGGGGRYDYTYFVDQNRVHSYAEEAVRQALVGLESRDAPAGELNVVLGPGWPGILLHEAVGHGLEGDFNRKQTSAFSGMVGQKVASEACTVVDDGTLAHQRGSLSVDDEGVSTQDTVLIEKGILKGYMQDKTNGRLMGVASTGNGRRESYAHLPMPRMTNTYMHNGEYDPEEIIRSVDHGVYAVNFGGGQVDITSGKFVFSASEAYMIEKGKVTYPVKGAVLIGNGPEVLKRVTMVGNDLALDPGVGVCGKDGQSVPVGVGQPTMRINGLTVGGVSV